MPAYIRESPAFVMISCKLGRSLGKASISTVMNALVMHEWADGYDGWFGSGIGSVIAGSACEGRMNQYANFASKHAICASNVAALAEARIRAASRSVR